MLLEKIPGWRVLVDVDRFDLDAALVQKTSGVFASGSGGLRVEDGFRQAASSLDNR
jgi:hypothetical protein